MVRGGVPGLWYVSCAVTDSLYRGGWGGTGKTMHWISPPHGTQHSCSPQLKSQPRLMHHHRRFFGQSPNPCPMHHHSRFWLVVSHQYRGGWGGTGKTMTGLSPPCTQHSCSPQLKSVAQPRLMHHHRRFFGQSPNPCPMHHHSRFFGRSPSPGGGGRTDVL